MRKDVKIGMLIGTGLCLAAVVWFCVHQPVVEQPRIEELLSQKKDLFATTTAGQVKPEPVQEQISTVKNSNIPQTVNTAPSTSGEKSYRMHTVLPGQTLSDISRIYYGMNGGWKKIYEANKDSLPRGPDTVRAGMKLIVPE
jgi:nucleoid-associated protein YgaU